MNDRLPFSRLVRSLSTTVIEEAERFHPEPGSAYIFAESFEPRSQQSEVHPETAQWNAVEISPSMGLTITRAGSDTAYTLGRSSEMRGFWEGVQGETIYLDITGLPHEIWAPLLKYALECKGDVRVTYIEPLEYTFSPAPTETSLFDLSERILGIAPLPGFVRLSEPEPDQESVLVALLGFEGARFAHILESLQPAVENVYVIVGVPGFRLEYPFYAYQGNRNSLRTTDAWKRATYAIANSPLDALAALETIAEQHPGALMQLAPIGTKPHSVGAVLYAIKHSATTEVVYDWPIRSPSRTIGAARQLVYFVSSAISDSA